MNIMKLMRLRHNFYAKHPDLGAEHLHLLERIAIREVEDNPLTVSAAMKMAEVASPATIHRMIDDLEFKGLVKRYHSKGDIRTKYLKLERQSVAYFNKLDREMGRM